jgi:hypothetical protein
MGGLDRYGKTITQRLGNDAVYGQGTDGDVTISSNTTLTGDKYYNNLTVNNGVTLLTNGYRVFVKNTLTNNGSIGAGTASAGEPTSEIATATVQGTSNLTTITYTVGGTGGGSTANAAPAWMLKNIDRLIEGKMATDLGYTPSGSTSAGLIYGGTSGITGAQGHTNPAYTNSDTWTGKSGNAGSAGHLRIHSQFATNHEVNHHNAGNAGNAGTAPNSGGAGIGGAGGSGGWGGGIVMIFAKSIQGTGTIFAKGRSGFAGSPGQTGAAGTNGNNGNTGYHGHHTFTHGCAGHTSDCKGNHHCSHSNYHGEYMYYGGSGGTGGAGSPTKTGGTGETGYRGGGGAIIIVTDSTPTNQSYSVSGGSSGTSTATAGSTYIILNT